MPVSCEEKSVLAIDLLKEIFGGDNSSAWNTAIDSHKGCDDINGSLLTGVHDQGTAAVTHDIGGLHMHSTGRDIYAYVTPVIILIGIFGNLISVKVFTSKVMRRLSSSYYLVTLSASDLIVLLTYVLFDWLNRGLPRWPGNHRYHVTNINGVCHFFLYMSYMFRFISVWLVVVFTAERFVAVCRPSHRKRLCTKAFAKKMIGFVFLLAAVVCIYKPFISGIYPTRPLSGSDMTTETVCTRNPAYGRLNFVLDSVYAVFITAVPFIVISALNMPILRKLIAWNRSKKGSKLVFRENRIRLEFTLILLVVSSCFIGLNMPYFIVWCKQFWRNIYPSYNLRSPTTTDRMSGQVSITRTIFYVNYCINFFLYCLTGAYYRREIRSMFRYYFNDRSKRRSLMAAEKDLRPLQVQLTQQTRCGVSP